jgi:MFS family permease
MRMMRLPAVWTTNVVALLFGAGMFSVIAFLPQFLQTPTAAGYGFGSTVTEAGLLMLPMLVTMSAGGSLSGPIASRISVKARLVWASTFSTIACAAFAAFHDRPWQPALAGALFSLGLGFGYAAMTSLIVQNVPVRQTGVASGMNANIRNIGGSIGTAIVSSLVTGRLRSDGLPVQSGYTHAFLLLTVTSAVTVGLALLVPVMHQQVTHICSDICLKRHVEIAFSYDEGLAHHRRGRRPRPASGRGGADRRSSRPGHRPEGRCAVRTGR